ncbi:HD domain-containing phosphohydrolase [Zobellella aerophila]|uniref:HD-GYP domain-containing protein n=1 Tax=Zobellella aerophila TaxID=870480 RepID=A0ABP6VS67_9GAMM
MQADNHYTPVMHPADIEAMVELLSQPGGASLAPDKPDGRLLPVVVVEQTPGESLQLDISAIREVAGELMRGLEFRLLGQGREGMIRTPMLRLRDCHESEGRLHCFCDYPVSLELMQRRETFRAQLRLGMDVGVILRAGEGEQARTLQGDLRDLSLTGCRVEFALSAGMAQVLTASPIELELCFPNGQRFLLNGELRHRHTDNDRQIICAGFHFAAGSSEQDRQLWYFVREIEREAARGAGQEKSGRASSALFQADESAAGRIGRRNPQEYATPMARRLARIAGYLDSQLLELQQDGNIDSVQLSRHADRLLALLDEDREALLFATRCMHREPPLVSHGLAVAVRLVDLLSRQNIPRELRKALAASAMVHDLGKILLPAELLHAVSPTTEQREQFKNHVALLLPRLVECQWLSAAVVGSVIQGANERLDGSGYPEGLAGDAVHELSRLMAVVDMVDVMARASPERPANSIDAIYRHLLSHPEQFDQRWVQRYIQHFGRFPIGTLVRYNGGELAWIQRLDERGRPSQVQLTVEATPPAPGLGEVLRNKELARLGAVEEIVTPAMAV